MSEKEQSALAGSESVAAPEPIDVTSLVESIEAPTYYAKDVALHFASLGYVAVPSMHIYQDRCILPSSPSPIVTTQTRPIKGYATTSAVKYTDQIQAYKEGWVQETWGKVVPDEEKRAHNAGLISTHSPDVPSIGWLDPDDSESLDAVWSHLERIGKLPAWWQVTKRGKHLPFRLSSDLARYPKDLKRSHGLNVDVRVKGLQVWLAGSLHHSGDTRYRVEGCKTSPLDLTREDFWSLPVLSPPDLQGFPTCKDGITHYQEAAEKRRIAARAKTAHNAANTVTSPTGRSWIEADPISTVVGPKGNHPGMTIREIADLGPGDYGQMDCPFHESEHGTSFSIRVKPDGRITGKCHASGCEASDLFVLFQRESETVDVAAIMGDVPEKGQEKAKKPAGWDVKPWGIFKQVEVREEKEKEKEKKEKNEENKAYAKALERIQEKITLLETKKKSVEENDLTPKGKRRAAAIETELTILRSQQEGLAEKVAPNAQKDDEPEEDANPIDTEALDGLEKIVEEIAVISGEENQKKNWVKVFPCPIYLTRRERVLGEDGIHVTARWKRMDEDPGEVRVPRGTLAQSRTILQLADEGAPVTQENAGDLVQWLAAYEACNLQYLKPAKSSASFGWLPEGEATDFVPYSQTVQYAGRKGSPRYAAIEKALHSPKATLEEWKTNVYANIESSPMVVLGLWASAAAPLIRWSQGRMKPFVWEFSGKSGSGKSVALQAIASFWGPWEGAFIHSWAGTNVGHERTFSLMGSLPVIYDDTNAVEAKERPRISNLIYTFVTGESKKQGTADGGLRPDTQWQTVLLTSGEDPLTGWTEQGGTKTRTIAVNGSPWGESKTVKAAEHAAKRYSGGAIPYLRYLHGEDKEKLSATLEKRMEKNEAAIERAMQASGLLADPTSRGVAMRQITALATIATAGDLVQKYLGQEGYHGRSCVDVVIEYLLPTVESAALGADPHARALEDFSSWVVAHSAYFSPRWDPKSRIEHYGQIMDGKVQVLTDVFRKWCEQSGHQKEGVLLGWGGRNCLTKNAKGKAIIQRTIDGSRTYVYEILIPEIKAPIVVEEVYRPTTKADTDDDEPETGLLDMDFN